MRIVALTAERAPEIAELAGCQWPYRLPCQDLAENLQGLDEDGCNFCFGLENEGRLTGFILAWVDNSLMEGRAEDVVLVEDVLLQPGSRRYLFHLLRQALKAMRSAGYRGLPVEGTLRQGAQETFTRHPEAMEMLGYRMAGSKSYHDEATDEDLMWVRFEPFEGPHPAESDGDDTSLDLEPPPPVDVTRE